MCRSGSEMPKARQLTSGEFSEGGHVWSTRRRRMFFTSNRVEEPFYYQSSDSRSVRGARDRRRDHEDRRHQRHDRQPRRSRPTDGRWRSSARSAARPSGPISQSDLFVVDAERDAAPANLTAGYDFDIGGGIGGDQAAPRGGSARDANLVGRRPLDRRRSRRTRRRESRARRSAAIGKIDAGVQGHARRAVATPRLPMHGRSWRWRHADQHRRLCSVSDGRGFAAPLRRSRR